jgi:hypothetical protein
MCPGISNVLHVPVNEIINVLYVPVNEIINVLHVSVNEIINVLHVPSFFDLRLDITPLVSSNFSCHFHILAYSNECG